jgi:sugar phosphate isomerase/epimerase
MAADFPLGIQSYCFRNFKPLDRLIDCLRQVGLKHVEIWPGHLSMDSDPADMQQALDTLAANGITVSSCGQIAFKGDEAATRKVFEFCKMAGITAVTADLVPEAREITRKLCDEYDVNLAIHNHGRKHALGRMEQLDELFAATSKRVGLCLDTAWLLDVGQDPLRAVERYSDRLYGVHLKDFAFDADGKPRDVIIGQGGLNLPKLMALLNDMNWSGYLSLEYEGNPDDPMAEVQTCVQAVQDAVAAL